MNKICQNCKYFTSNTCKKFNITVEAESTCSEWKLPSTSNKLFNLSYFRHRFGKAGISTIVIKKDFKPSDKRKWCILLTKYDVFCTCLVNIEPNGDIINTFIFSDSNQNLRLDLRVTTKSMNYIFEELSKYIKF